MLRKDWNDGGRDQSQSAGGRARWSALVLGSVHDWRERLVAGLRTAPVAA